MLKNISPLNLLGQLIYLNEMESFSENNLKTENLLITIDFAFFI